MHSTAEDIQGLPDDVEKLRALLLTTIAERDAALSERDPLQRQNDRLYDLLRKLRRMQFGAQIRATAGRATPTRFGSTRAGDRAM